MQFVKHFMTCVFVIRTVGPLKCKFFIYHVYLEQIRVEEHVRIFQLAFEAG